MDLVAQLLSAFGISNASAAGIAPNTAGNQPYGAAYNALGPKPATPATDATAAGNSLVAGTPSEPYLSKIQANRAPAALPQAGGDMLTNRANTLSNLIQQSKQ